MSPVTFRDVVYLVNRISGTRIDVEKPRYTEADQFAVYSGAVSSSGFSFEFEILYLFSDITKDGIRKARTWLSRKSDRSRIKIVSAPSITLNFIDEFSALGVECLSLADYFLSFMSQQTEAYISKLRQLSFKDYIDPQIETPTGFNRRSPNPVLGFVTAPEYSVEKGEIAVLLGEPGQGKTHMSKYLAVELSKRKTIPIYVHSEQWMKMQVEDLSSIWKTIVGSFRYFETPIGWAEGVERDFISVSLKLGIFRLIFDGFDEFILWNRGTIDPRESLRELLSLADETGTILCLTSRTSFWRAETAEVDGAEIEGRERIFEFTIQPFDVNHARNYFIKRFGVNEAQVVESVRLFERLKQDSSNDAMSFVGRGFFLSLIADLVSRGFSADQVGDTGQTRLQWIMDALCQREQVRQKLPIDSVTQLIVLREFAEIIARGEVNNSATLRMVIELTTELDTQQIDQLVKAPAKLKDHPLMYYAKESNSWHYTQDQIEYVLLAERILDLSGRPSEFSSLASLLNSAVFTKRLQMEVATALVQHIFETRTDTEALERCKIVIAQITQSGKSERETNDSNGSHQFAGRVALLAASRAHSRGGNRSERTNALLNILPGGQLVGLQFVGTISGLDLRDLDISNCHFDTVTFANCRFSKTTKFSNCRFSDLRATNCEQFGLVLWDSSNRFDEMSRRLVEAEMVNLGRRTYLDENLMADLDCLIRKFLPRETSGFKKVEERNLSRGLIGHSIHKNSIIEVFKKHALLSHPVNGSAAYAVEEAAKPSFTFYVGNGVLTGSLALLKEELRKKLGISM